MKQMTTGASNDFEVATDMAYNMVARWGMSEKLGTRVYAESQTEMMHGLKKNMSNETAQLVDTEHCRILDEQYDRARQILVDHNDKVEMMTKALMEWETIDATQIADIMAGKEPKPPMDIPKPTSNTSGDDKGDKPSVEPQMDSPASDA